MAHRRLWQFGRALVGLSALLAAGQAAAQNYPDKPVRIIVGFTAGSATDITARLFAQKFNEAWENPVTVGNIPGAGGGCGAQRGAKTGPDGHPPYLGSSGALKIYPSLPPTAPCRTPP